MPFKKEKFEIFDIIFWFKIALINILIMIK